MELTDLQRRILEAAAFGAGRIMFWVLGSGRAMLPGFGEDVSGSLRALEGAGLLETIGPDGQPARPAGELAKGSHVRILTAAGRRAISR